MMQAKSRAFVSDSDTDEEDCKKYSKHSPAKQVLYQIY